MIARIFLLATMFSGFCTAAVAACITAQQAESGIKLERKFLGFDQTAEIHFQDHAKVAPDGRRELYVKTRFLDTAGKLHLTQGVFFLDSKTGFPFLMSTDEETFSGSTDSNTPPEKVDHITSVLKNFKDGDDEWTSTTVTPNGEVTLHVKRQQVGEAVLTVDGCPYKVINLNFSNVNLATGKTFEQSAAYAPDLHLILQNSVGTKQTLETTKIFQ